MKTRTITLSLALCFFGAALCLAANVNMGTWKLNEAKSKFSPGAPKTSTAMYEAVGESIKVTLDGTGFDGKPAHTEWTGMFDGKDYPIAGDSNQSTRSYTKVNAHTLKFKVKNGDKVILTGTIVTAPDGMNRTVTATGTTTDGKKISFTAVYDKQ